MLDPALLRRPAKLVRDALADRGDPTSLDNILALDERHRSLKAAIDQARAERNTFSKLLGQAHGLLDREGPNAVVPKELHQLLALVGRTEAGAGPPLASVVQYADDAMRERIRQKEEELAAPTQAVLF